MLPLHHESWFTFRFADARIIPRFHLEGMSSGTPVSVIKIDPDSGKHLGLLATATVGDGGWVDLPQPIVVRAGEAFIAVPIEVRPENDWDHAAVRQINRLAFGQDGEARLVDALRGGGLAPVSLVAQVDGQVVGHIMFSDLKIATDKGDVPALALAPMAVLPEFQRQGIGSTLVRRGLELCKEQGRRIVVVLGHADFNPRFGFSAKLAECLESPYGSGPSHMAIELVAGALSGVAGRSVRTLVVASGRTLHWSSSRCLSRCVDAFFERTQAPSVRFCQLLCHVASFRFGVRN
jgi:putative acetyltransferase